ncbi:MAG: protein kinase [Acidobacteriota bacterium]|nr:protein kinase [Acidobacteriota bacterium]
MAGSRYEKRLEQLCDLGRISPERAAALGDALVGLDEDTASQLFAQATANPEAPPAGPADMPTADVEAPARTDSSQAPEHRFPIPNWSRYEPAGFLGEGGMGLVFRGYDPRLDRHVALKFLNTGDPERVQRFIREARAQARVEHEHICKVYEVGEVEGRPFIAMQFIDGVTLAEAAATMDLHQKLTAVQQVARGMHTAHLAGLVHRDLKPANIMLEPLAGGGFHPYVTDFGLARFEHGQELTVDGDVLGTPGYMAPEQALGRIDKLDRRTDVYALGATLYRILTGVPPYHGLSQAAVLGAIVTEEPKPPRRCNPDLPADVETIVLTCLEKQRHRRYDSAHALADDLDRYLNGDPILARPAGLGYRLQKLLRKHRTVAWVALAAVLLLLVSLGWGTWRAARKEHLARELTERTAEIQALADYSRLAPAHDIRGDRAKLDRRLAAIQAEIDRAGSLARGPGSYALGAALLALERYQPALEHLQRAWQLGYRQPRVAYALGVTYAARYRDELARARLITDVKQQQLALSRIGADYRDPALEFLQRASPTEVTSPDFLAALIAYCRQDFDEALTHLAAASRASAWFYQAVKLEADIYRDLAGRSNEAGDVDRARAYFDRALATYARAAEIAASDPDIYKGACRALLQMFLMETFSTQNIKPHLDKGLALITAALTLDPDDLGATELCVKLYRYAALRSEDQGEDPGPLLGEAERIATEALARSGDHSLLHLELGRIYWQWAQWRNNIGGDPRAMIRAAAASLDKVAEKDRDYRFDYTYGSAQKAYARRQAGSGEQACDAYERAIVSFRRAVISWPGHVAMHNNLTLCLISLSAIKTCPGNPIARLEEAVSVMDAAIAVKPSEPVLYYQKGRALFRLAQGGDVGSGRLDGALADQALTVYQQAAALRPEWGNLYNVIGGVHLTRGRHAWEIGRAPDPFFNEALAAYTRAAELMPKSRLVPQNRAWVHFYRGKFLVREGKDGEADLEKAFDFAQQALDRGGATTAHLCRGSVWRLRGEQVFHDGGDPSPFLEKAAASFAAILAKRADDAEAHRSLGRTHTLQARGLIAAGLDPGSALQRAGQSLTKALELEREAAHFPIAMVRYQLVLAEYAAARGQTDEAAITHAMALLDRIEAVRPGYAEAGVLRACLLKLKGSEPERARHELRQALETNAFLSSEWVSRFGLLGREDKERR